jgi:hypothetical protein
MPSTASFPPFRPDLALKRRGLSIPPRPMESDTVAFDGVPGNHAQNALQLAWDKLYRARAILEAEQAHLRDDRISMQGDFDALQAREQAVAARELRMQQLELQGALDRAEAADAQAQGSALGRLTRAPFEMARSVFSPKK